MSTFQFGNVSLNSIFDTKERCEAMGGGKKGFEERIGILHFRIGFILQGGKTPDEDTESIDLVRKGICGIGLKTLDVGGRRQIPFDGRKRVRVKTVLKGITVAGLTSAFFLA